MKLIADTNLLVRAAVQDDLAQARLAMKALEAAELIVVPVPCFCEFAWVLLRAYKFTEADTVQAIQAFWISRKWSPTGLLSRLVSPF